MSKSFFQKSLLLFFIPFCFYSNSSAQIENVTERHPVYPFLKKMQVQGVLKNYDDFIIPFSREEVNSFLSQIDSRRNELSTSDREFLDRMKDKLSLMNEDRINLFDEFTGELIDNLIADKEKHLYHYKDSVIFLYVDPIMEYKFIYSDIVKSSASLLNYGGVIAGSYNDWFGFYLEGTNGTVFGNRNSASIDKRVEQSFTFNNTKINFFDGTQGYLRIHKDIFNLQLGRERILWGRGNLNRMILSDNPPLFDFIKIDLSYKSLKYDFIHAWLIQPKISVFVDSLSGEIRNKPAKYLAVSRLSFTPNENISFGVSQAIIYANRPFEAAYLNPFLVWESAQRSLNDLDNSFLSLDGRYKMINGLEFNSAILIDDIHFGKLFKNWATIHNRIAWQVGAMITSPLSFDDLTLKFEYLQIRPYIFIHPGLGESLTYTNNTYLLGFDLPPNSIRLSAELSYRLSGRMNITLRYDHSLHGNNIYDKDEKLVRNVGANIYENNTISDPETAYLLDGDRELTDYVSINYVYEFLYGFYLEAEYQFRRNVLMEKKTLQNILWGSVRINF